jgi:NAD(P)-dependent dehydrogenase (short-subunit alcohol dehydrogenase family)
MRDFDGKVVLVTGASTGLGAAIAVGAATRGAKAVIINYAKSAAEAEATAEAVRAAGAEAVLAQGDVGDDVACRAIVEKAAPYGRIDALANNAGVTKFAPNHGDLDALQRADFENVFAVNVIGPFQMLRAARPLLEAAERASVLMISSIAGVTGIGSSVAYAASKGALNTMTLSLARTLGPKVRINALCPGFIDTPWHAKGLSAETVDRVREGTKRMTPLQAASTAEDIADAGLFFLSDASRHVTGETLLVDAGLHLGFASFSQR